MTDFQPHFAFSFSRYKSFRDCPRRYYLQTIESWNGWRRDAPERAQLCYRLSKMETLFSLSGKVVHSAIAEGLEDRALGVEAAREWAHREMRSAWMQSASGWAERRPGSYGKHPAKAFCGLAEHYYPAWGVGSRFGVEDPKATARKAWARAEAAIWRAWRTETFAEARESRILALEDLPKEENRPALTVPEDDSRCVGCGCTDMHHEHEGTAGGFMLRGACFNCDHCERFREQERDPVPTWVRLDLAYERKGEPRKCVVVDWKSGRPRPDADGAQIQLYGLFTHQLWGVRLEQIELQLPYLGSDPVEVVKPGVSWESIGALRDAIPQAADEIRSRLDDPALNAGPEEAFERTEDRSKCSTCAMFEACYGHRDMENPN